MDKNGVTTLIKKLFSLIKPGIIFGNAITVAGGFFLGAKGFIDYKLFLVTLIGISLIIASGCTYNNYIDRDIDKLMYRTQNRVLAASSFNPKIALIYATVLGFIGTILLYFKTNLLTLILALIGLFFYVIVYSLWFKRNSIYGTIIGSISGAIPPVVGYCAVTNRFDLGALLLFIILSLWQIPHSFAIAIFRLEDYKTAGIAVLPAKKGITITIINMLVYIILFVIVSEMLFIFNYTGLIYSVVIGIIGLLWIKLCLQGFKIMDKQTWARKMFASSVIIITIFSVMIAIDFNNHYTYVSLNIF